MTRRDVVVIGGSAGAHKPLTQLLSRLPADLPAAVLVVLHLAPGARSTLAEMLGSACALPVRTAADGEPIRTGQVYVGAADRHLVVDGDVLRLSDGPRQNRVRPAVDALFRAVARWCGPRAIGVVLSGSLDDGAAGLAAIVAGGGLALVQDPAEARFPGMPRAALRVVPQAVTASALDLGDLVAGSAGQPTGAGEGPQEALRWETDMIADGSSDARDRGEPVALGCPECHGGMYVVRTGRAAHYVCHVGHSYSPQTLLAARDNGLEEALWTAVSVLQEKVMILRELIDQAEKAGEAEVARGYRAEADRTSAAAALLQEQAAGSRRTAAR
ncbi:chemotaxis protein CheB [Actinoplanes sp. SE50]|uniref:chemotaxis protein CheB n=1 Tax=unclassified Actinoplanes TaxID=2626549 RepID=UPI00023EC5CF|nr:MULTISPECIES: chemotaxis protein CheB [unclassified Actinoplanes]AEV83625.1 two-component system, chemotaxis family, response regulator CheB [Actinoplanes sp. SE50/110]ATO82231.1 chemotaxis protein CheB [Actinoplanes sp. SE50]SLL99638.1 chemotaxis protein CheB [Actinoplanes sp. SE50/110]